MVPSTSRNDDDSEGDRRSTVGAHATFPTMITLHDGCPTLTPTRQVPTPTGGKAGSKDPPDRPSLPMEKSRRAPAPARRNHGGAGDHRTGRRDRAGGERDRLEEAMQIEGRAPWRSGGRVEGLPATRVDKDLGVGYKHPTTRARDRPVVLCTRRARDRWTHSLLKIFK